MTRLRRRLALALVVLAGCAGIEGSPIGTAGQAGTETNAPTGPADGDDASATATMTNWTSPTDDGQPPGDPTTGGLGDTTSFGLDGSSTGGRPPQDGSDTGDGGEASATDGDQPATDTGSNAIDNDTDTGTGTGTGTDTGTDTGSGTSGESG